MVSIRTLRFTIFTKINHFTCLFRSNDYNRNTVQRFFVAVFALSYTDGIITRQPRMKCGTRWRHDVSIDAVNNPHDDVSHCVPRAAVTSCKCKFILEEIYKWWTLRFNRGRGDFVWVESIGFDLNTYLWRKILFGRVMLIKMTRW